MGGARESVTGIQAGMERLGTAASNIAGAITQGYESQRVEPVPRVEGDVRAHGHREGRDRVDISQQAVELMEAEHLVEINIKVVQRLDQIETALLEIGE